MIRARKRAGAEAITCLLLFAVYLLFLGSLVPSFSRAGWCVGPRYITVVLPFVAWLAVAGFEMADRFVVTRVLAWALVFSSSVIFVVAATTYPHWPEGFHNPLYELAFRLLYHGYAVHSLGTLVGLTGFWSILPLYLLALGLAMWIVAGSRKRIVSAAIAVVLAGAIIAAHRQFPVTGPYALRAYSWITSTWEPKRQP